MEISQGIGRDGRLSQPAFGGLFGGKGIRDIFGTRVALWIR
ncbi:hypothetical protein MTR67_051640 [Solanum verrucosum]|uniref:Uncharacterized protein n=1 Tax=Solanum verrucosum TaxID=315347 RepID=A0AAF0V4A3_SOLVR|nr:hypothetical protein MTR67_051640 [Solanum verrucosum]